MRKTNHRLNNKRSVPHTSAAYRHRVSNDKYIQLVSNTLLCDLLKRAGVL